MVYASYRLLSSVFTFFVVTYFWVQEFPIGVCIDCISIVEMPGIDEVMNLKKTREEKNSDRQD